MSQHCALIALKPAASWATSKEAWPEDQGK